MSGLNDIIQGLAGTVDTANLGDSETAKKGGALRVMLAKRYKNDYNKTDNAKNMISLAALSYAAGDTQGAGTIMTEYGKANTIHTLKKEAYETKTNTIGILEDLGTGRTQDQTDELNYLRNNLTQEVMYKPFVDELEKSKIIANISALAGLLSNNGLNSGITDESDRVKNLINTSKLITGQAEDLETDILSALKTDKGSSKLSEAIISSFPKNKDEDDFSHLHRYKDLVTSDAIAELKAINDMLFTLQKIIVAKKERSNTNLMGK